MDVLKLLEYIQDILETSSGFPFTGKILVDKEEIMETIEKIINVLPDEFKKAQWVVEEKERILSDAMQQAETLRKENTELMKKQVENHDFTREAKVMAEEIIATAQRDAKAIRLGARDYADEILTQLEKEIDNQGSEMVHGLSKEVESFVSILQNRVSDTTNTIRENIKELRSMK